MFAQIFPLEYGSTINLTCIVKQSPDPPTNIVWTHKGGVRLHSKSFYTKLKFFAQEVSYDSSRGGISVITEKSDITTSYLLIQRAKSKDSGVYTCEPSNAKASNITVHILNGNLIYIIHGAYLHSHIREGNKEQSWWVFTWWMWEFSSWCTMQNSYVSFSNNEEWYVLLFLQCIQQFNKSNWAFELTNNL